MAEAIARAIVRDIEQDLRDRAGLGEVWDALGAERQHEVLERWMRLVDWRVKTGVLRLLETG
jgi:hypothetical protein